MAPSLVLFYGRGWFIMGWSRSSVLAVAGVFACALVLAASAGSATVSPSPEHSVPSRVFAPRGGPAVAWFEGRLFVFGGVAVDSATFLDDGALIDPTSGRASRVQDLRGDPLMSPVALTTGKRLVAMGFACADTYVDEDLGDIYCTDGRFAAAELNPTSGRWRPLQLPDELTARKSSDVADTWWPRALGTLSDGRAVFATVNAVPAGGDLEYRTQLWTYSPTTRAWTAVPTPPSPVDENCLAGDRIVALTGSPVAPSLLVFDATGSAEWHATQPSSSVTLTDDPRMSCAGEHVVVTGIRQGPPIPADILNVAVANLDDGTWSQATGPGYPEPIPDPSRGVGLLTAGLWTGTELVYPSGAYAYDPTTNAWRELKNVAPHDQPISVWTGHGIAGYVTDRTGKKAHASVYIYPLD